MKEMSFRVATSSKVVAKAILSDCQLNEGAIEFKSEQIASAMFNALKDAGYDTEVLFLDGNYIASYSVWVEFKKSETYCNAVEILWSQDTFHHIQAVDGIGCWLRKLKTHRINLEK